MSQREHVRTLNGRWCGEYQYNLTPNGYTHQKIVPFVINIQLGRFGDFTGNVQDDPRYGAPEEGRITGSLQGHRITFTKRMPVYRMAYQGRSITLDVFVREYYHDQLPDHITHPDILYEGHWEPSIEEFRGVWRIPQNQIKLKSRRVLASSGGTGTWRMAPC